LKGLRAMSTIRRSVDGLLDLLAPGLRAGPRQTRGAAFGRVSRLHPRHGLCEQAHRSARCSEARPRQSGGSAAGPQPHFSDCREDYARISHSLAFCGRERSSYDGTAVGSQFRFDRCTTRPHSNSSEGITW